MEAILLGYQCTFLSTTVFIQGIFLKIQSSNFDTCATNDVCLVAICQWCRSLDVENKVPFRPYLSSHSREFHDASRVAIYNHAQQPLYGRDRSVTKGT